MTPFRPSSSRATAIALLLAGGFAPLAAAAAAGSAGAPAMAQLFIVSNSPKKDDTAARWYSDVRDAFAQSKKSGKPLLVDLYAEWCGWCKVMEQKVFSQPEFTRFAADYVLLRIDVEDGGQGSELASRYDSESLPTLLLLEPSGALIGDIRGYTPMEELVQQAHGILSVHEKAIESYQKLLQSSDTQALRSAASEFYSRRDGERAANLFARVLAVEPSSGDQAAWLRFFHADSLRRAGRLSEAADAAKAAAPLAAKATDPELAERLELLPFWIAKDAAQCADASGALASFERGHPESVFLPGAKRALAELRGGRATCS